MPGIASINGGFTPRLLGAALIAAVGVPLCRIALGGHLGELTLVSAALPAVVVFAVVAACAYLGGRYGFLLLWTMVAAGWLMILIPMLADARGEPFTAMMQLPDGFLAWTMTALPLAFATGFWTRPQRPFALPAFAAATTVWLALAAVNAFLARYAPDVGGTPRQDPALVWLVGSPSIVAPFLVCHWFIQWLRTHPRPREGLSPQRA